MKKILFSLIALLCSMSINAQVMKVMKGEEVVATFTSAQANQVVFGEDTPFTMTVGFGSVVSLTGEESYEAQYPSTTVLGVYGVKKDKNVASMISYVETTEKVKELIDVETASAEELKAFVIANGYKWTQQGISNVNSEWNIVLTTNRTPNTEYTAIVYATSEEADEYVTYVRATTAKEPLVTTGTATRTGGIDVKWVQLWENGPKFAEYNVGNALDNLTPAQLIEKIKTAYAQAKEEGKSAIYGFGWNYENFKKAGMPTLAQLDEACPDIPLLVSDSEGHYALINTACLVKAGFLDAEGKVLKSEIPGGELDLDEFGNPTGLLKDEAGTFCKTNGIDADYLLFMGGEAENYGGHYTWGGSINNDPAGAYYEGSDNLTGDNDTATKLWGSNWRMPQAQVFYDLESKCDIEWTTINGVNGRKFTGKGDYASNSIFLPAAGYGRGGQGNTGYYWSSTPEGSEIADYMIFSSASQQVGIDRRSNSYSVRAVLVEE